MSNTTPRTPRTTPKADAPNGSRRTFLKQSGTAVAGAAIASTLASRTYAQGSDTVKFALIGCGGRGTGAAAQALSTTNGPIKLVAMADVFEDKLEASYQNLNRAAQQGSLVGEIDVPQERRFVGFDAFKKAIDSDVDMLVIATPPGWRPQHFEYAVQQNRHVFMEKPLSADAPGVRRILKANEEAKKKNLKVGVGLQRHHQRTYEETVQRVHDGAIGDVHTLRVYWNGAGVWTRPRQPGMNEMEYQMLNWYYFNWLCGDHIVEQHIHNLDVGNWVKNAHPIGAQGMGGREVRTGKEHGQIFDHHAVEFIYPDGARMISQCRHMPGCYNAVSEYAHGSKGSAVLSGAAIYNDQAGRDTKWKFEGDSPNPYQVEHNTLQDAIRNDTPYNEVEYGAHSTMTAILGRMATYSGKFLRWDTMLNDGKELAPGQDEYTWESTPPVTPNEDGYYPVPVPGEYDPTAPINADDNA